jgi:acetyl esterase/lipase
VTKLITDLEPWLDPELRDVFAMLPEVSRGTRAIAQERKELAPLVDRARSQRFVERHVPGSTASDPAVRVRTYRPAQAAEPLPALVWMHGGAWSLGGPEFDEHLLQRWADEASLFAISVDYRLAPEHPYPAALHDCEAAVRWACSSASELGVDPARIGIGGSSAGANLAAGLCLKLRDSAGPQAALQLLLYPVLDDRLNSGSMKTLADPRTLTREFLSERWRAYLGHDRCAPQYAAPARALDLTHLPPTLILAGELDPLRDEAVEYARRLWFAAGSCELLVLQGAIHGCDAIAPESAVARASLAWVVSALARGLRAPHG